jgi:hypothetical protein
LVRGPEDGGVTCDLARFDETITAICRAVGADKPGEVKSCVLMLSAKLDKDGARVQRAADIVLGLAQQGKTLAQLRTSCKP